MSGPSWAPSARSGTRLAKRGGGPARAHIGAYIGLLHASETRLVRAFEQVRSNHTDAPDIEAECTPCSEWSRKGAQGLEPFIARYGERQEGEPERLDGVLTQSAQALPDKELEEVLACDGMTAALANQVGVAIRRSRPARPRDRCAAR